MPGYEVIEELPVIGIFDKGKLSNEPTMMQKAEELGKKQARLLC